MLNILANKSLKLEDIILKGIPFGITSFIIQDLLQGTKTVNQFNRLKLYLENQKIFSPIGELVSFINAAKIYFDLRKRGLSVRSSTECLIAQNSIEHDQHLLHNDKDFLTIAKVVPLKFY